MPSPFEPQLSAGGRSKIVSPSRQDIRDPSEPGEHGSPIGHVAAASARNGGAGDEIREGNLRRQEGHHQGLAGFGVNRQESDSVDRSQQQHGDDHTQPW